jgi:hypothetical protein
MTRFCPNCGKPYPDDSTTVCANCGFDQNKPIPSQSAQPAQQKHSLGREELIARAVPFFTSRDYALQTQTDYVVTFESQSRDINWIFFVVFCCIGLLPGVIYYYWFTQQHRVTISLTGAAEVKVTAMGNTSKAKTDAGEFIQTIM